jgi:glycerol-3-phosphate acyltransferase PlsY
MSHLYTFLLAYLLGSIPFGLIVTKLIGKGDIRKQGSGNIGATNVTRSAGKLWGITTFLLDGLKGALAIFLAHILISDLDYQIISLAAGGAVIGHIFPIWLKFKGGKGVATSLAVIAVLNWHIALASGLIWLLFFYTKRIVSVASIAAMLCSGAYSAMIMDKYFIVINLLAFIVILKHSTNIRKLIKGEELAFKK